MVSDRFEVKTPYFKIARKLENSNVKEDDIAIWLNSYNDIFSSFDPRPYPQRALNDTFLLELRRACKVKDPSKVRIKFLIGDEKRSMRDENLIRKRLHDHFRKHYDAVQSEIKKSRAKGIGFIITGVALVLVATWMQVYFKDRVVTSTLNFGKTLLTILLGPGSLFMMWNGFERTIIVAEKEGEDRKFYKTMSECPIEFETY